MKEKISRRVVLYLLCLAYVLYLIYDSVQKYLGGEADIAPPLFFASVGVLSLAALVLAVLTYRSWKREKNAQDAERELGSVQDGGEAGLPGEEEPPES